MEPAEPVHWLVRRSTLVRNELVQRNHHPHTYMKTQIARCTCLRHTVRAFATRHGRRWPHQVPHTVGIELGCRVVTAVPSTLHVARLLSTCHITRPIWLFCLFILRFSPSLLSPFLLFGTPTHSEHGVKEAGIAGERLKASGLQPTKLHTSLQTRACRTANIALEVLDRLWIPVNRAWHLPTHCNPP